MQEDREVDKIAAVQEVLYLLISEPLMNLDAN